ncbi:Uncharacterized protein dnm_073300 [Desulfonema magnum]|uniref:Uncharacterized protein n=1 Tax=Desulfonema magnum TaxID=45655 RepID=A0A975BTB6_9BACT|nr:Uncharacterized protein dnm_073300 [Desulfonema magnum]
MFKFFLSFLRKQESTVSGSAASAENGFLLSREWQAFYPNQVKKFEH